MRDDRPRFGLKLFSTNGDQRRGALRLYRAGMFQFVELYVVPGTFADTAGAWVRELPVPYVVHAPHFMHGLNLSRRECVAGNRRLMAEARRFADRLKAPFIVVHPGLAGDYRETIRQVRALREERLLIENKPFIGLNGKRCVGSSGSEIQALVQGTGAGFCLDVGHAVRTAYANDEDPYRFIAALERLGPRMVHVCDGKIEGCFDEHLSIGAGEYDWKRILSLLLHGRTVRERLVTIETKRRRSRGLRDFVDDVRALRDAFR